MDQIQSGYRESHQHSESGIDQLANINEDSIIYFNLYDTFLMETGLNYDRLLSHEVKYPTLVTNFVNIKKFTHLDQIQLTTAIENIINEIREIFRSFTNFEMDLGIL